MQIVEKRGCPYSERVRLFCAFDSLFERNIFHENIDNALGVAQYPALVDDSGSIVYESSQIIQKLKSYTKMSTEPFLYETEWSNMICLWRESLYSDADRNEIKIAARDISSKISINNLSLAFLLPHIYRFQYTNAASPVYQALKESNLIDLIKDYLKSNKLDELSDEIILPKADFLRYLVSEPLSRRSDFYGLSQDKRCYFDTAATGMPLKQPIKKREELLNDYASAHSTVSSFSKKLNAVIPKARNNILEYFELDKSNYSVLFIGNGATAAANYLSHLLNKDIDVIATSLFEHHSSDLPYRKTSKVVKFPNRLHKENYTEDLIDVIENEGAEVVVVTSCSNVNGHRPPIGILSEIAYRNEVGFYLDISQSAAHHDLRLADLPRLDGFYFSGHKVYAPEVLIIRTSILDSIEPALVGGGAVDDVSVEDFSYSPDITSKHQAGTLDVLGINQLSDVISYIKKVGIKKIEAHESWLTEYMFLKLSELDGIVIYSDYMGYSGVIAFNISGMHHEIAASILFDDYGIEVRNACFCAHPYVRDLLRIESIKNFQKGLETIEYNGMLRVSFGLYSKVEEVDRIIAALRSIVAKTKSD
ncbi:hypothetical protein AB835_12165 [Candidatus Endobugula sertula]|uniref:Aminotransferase class V domain-containing protein n=1 Tax=Candidatus Endobugula sertula TaxID=62101 RepID=A0A1D2QMN6_9GAMM|nr:hypothetical protein AB835_12165 [Candidatus Endobugula sertula]